MTQYIHHVEIASVVNINHFEKHLLQMIMVYIEQLSVKDVKQVEVCLDFYEVFFFFLSICFFKLPCCSNNNFFNNNLSSTTR